MRGVVEEVVEVRVRERSEDIAVRMVVAMNMSYSSIGNFGVRRVMVVSSRSM